MQIKEGKYYRTAAGDKVGPMIADDSFSVPAFIEKICDGRGWSRTGLPLGDNHDTEETLIAEYREAQPGDRIRMLEDDHACGYKAGDHFVTVDGESFVDNDGDKRPLDVHPHEVVGAAEKPLQVGDRVRAIRGRPCGHTGTIIEDVGDGMPLVKFDDWHNGHNGNGSCGRSGYFCEEEDLERIEAPAFKKGDRVRALANDPEGEIGTVAALDAGDGQVLVAFDNWRRGHGGSLAGLALGDSGWWLLPDELERIEEPASGAPADGAPEFKVGDRISGVPTGQREAVTGRVRHVDSNDPHNTYAVDTDCGIYQWLRTATCRAAPLRVEAGKHYRTQSGAVVGPMLDFAAGRFIKELGDGHVWLADGKRHCGTLGDIVAEVAAQEAAQPAFKVGDRVRFTDKCPRTWWFGPHTKHKEGVITTVDGKGTYGVETGAMYDPALVFGSDQIEPAPSPTRHAIVAAIENGKPKPAHRPRVHPDRATASKEAERLAHVNPGKEFGVYELAETRSTAAPKHEWQRLAAAGKRNDAVAELMRVAGVAAPSAFSAVDRFRNAA